MMFNKNRYRIMILHAPDMYRFVIDSFVLLIAAFVPGFSFGTVKNNKITIRSIAGVHVSCCLYKTISSSLRPIVDLGFNDNSLYLFFVRPFNEQVNSSEPQGILSM